MTFLSPLAEQAVSAAMTGHGYIPHKTHDVVITELQRAGLIWQLPVQGVHPWVLTRKGIARGRALSET